jgi:hypothetical protein
MFGHCTWLHYYSLLITKRYVYMPNEFVIITKLCTVMLEHLCNFIMATVFNFGTSMQLYSGHNILTDFPFATINSCFWWCKELWNWVVWTDCVYPNHGHPTHWVSWKFKWSQNSYHIYYYNKYSLSFFPMVLQPRSGHGLGTPLDEWLAHRIGLYWHRTAQHINTKTNIHDPSRIRTCDPSSQAAKTYALHCAATRTGKYSFTLD